MSLLPPPSGPSGAWADLREFFRTNTGVHKVGIAALAFGYPAFMFTMMYLSQKTIEPRPAKIIYVSNWPKSRTDAQIRAQQMADQAKRDERDKLRKAAQEERRRQFKELEDTMNSIGM
jgi:hypothetical protein